jgi:hypothetical protein
MCSFNVVCACSNSESDPSFTPQGVISEHIHVGPGHPVLIRDGQINAE